MKAAYDSLRGKNAELQCLSLAERLLHESHPLAGCYLEHVATEWYLPQQEWRSAGDLYQRAGNAWEYAGERKCAMDAYTLAKGMYLKAGLLQEAQRARALARSVQTTPYV